ncbi:uncharacterized protein LOC128206091 [Mya arenaria]|uniref:uncharacterized protein LOC128206091 n=1 Tax=Mya arenaria TaxID=6604 RepID=UPI0022E91BA5|nr:uncharacterized protein LOC128206091 [Mya arenaria]
MLWAIVFASEDACERPKEGEKACGSSDTSDQNNNTPEESGVWDSVKKGLHSVKVSKYDATELERQLHGELFDSWKESCEVMKTSKIRVENLQAYLDHLTDTYEGIGKDTRKKMNGVLFSDGSWEHKVVDWNFSPGKTSGSRYGMLAFGKSADAKYVDAMFVMYKMDFKISPKVIVTEKQNSALFGFIKWTSKEEHLEETKLGPGTIKRLQNFFRVKALEGFYNEGIIDEINYTATLDENSNS